MKYNILYKTTNLINDKIYIGIHRQSKPPYEYDGYLGSGLLLLRAMNKYGRDKFFRETLMNFDTYQEARDAERELVNIDFLLREDVYNISIGGTGGNTRPFLTEYERKIFAEKVMSTRIKNNTIVSAETRKIQSAAAKERIKKYPNSIPSNKHRVHSEKGLKNIQEGARRRKGRWVNITNGLRTLFVESTRVIPVGWKAGRGKDVVIYGRIKSKEEIEKTANHPNKKGTKCYTNGVKNLRLKPTDEIPLGFTKGMTTFNRKKVMWITDGTKSKQVVINHALEDNWRKGRVL